MPGQAWRRPGDGPTEGPAEDSTDRADRSRPPARIGAAEVSERITDLEISIGLDSATRLSSASGGSPADAQSPPISPPYYNGLSLVVGRRVARLGSNKWTLASIGMMVLVLIVALASLALQGSWTMFYLGLVVFFVASAFVARALQLGS
jgi:hypothetical protein